MMSFCSFGNRSCLESRNDLGYMSIKKKAELSHHIIVEKARVHNLKSVSCNIPHNAFVCLTGISGSGKSSFAFDTLYAEAQRRYILSLSHQAKRLLSTLEKPDVEAISGLTPTVAIEQRSSANNPRSTIGTMTEIYDFLRLLYARVGIPHCPETGEPLIQESKETILRSAFDEHKGKKVTIVAPFVHDKKSSLEEELTHIDKKGFTRVRLDGKLIRIDEVHNINKDQEHSLDIVIDRLEVNDEHKTRYIESLCLALEEGKGSFLILFNEEERVYSLFAYSKLSNRFYTKLEPHDFSFNSPSGMCPECQGLGQKQQFIKELVLNEEKSISEDCCSVASSYQTVRYRNIYDNLARIYEFSVHTPFKNLSSQAQQIFLYGTEKKWTRMLFIHPHTGATWYDHIQWKGVLHEAYVRYTQATSVKFKQGMEQLMKLSICPVCRGGRLKAYPLACKFHNLDIQTFCSLSIKEALSWIKNLILSEQEKELAAELLLNIQHRLQFLFDVGLGYLSLNRTAPTLSGGEAQRVRLASHLGSGLVGITYILDEPSIGLHPIDNAKLIKALHALQRKGNTVIVVEHDEETIRSADYILDFGPGAGILGGTLLHQGPLDTLLSKENSLTADYLSSRKTVSRKTTARALSNKQLILEGASLHNLKNVTLKLPLERFIAITGVSGSGKSSLLMDTLWPALSRHLMKSELLPGPYTNLIGLEHIDKVISIDQTPIGRTPRSNPATYIKLFDDIRTLFASIPEAQAKGWNEGRFSFNVKEGSCPECSGMGQLQVDMDFLEPAWITCPLCLGQRFDNETLSVRWKGKSIADVLMMTCQEALNFFDNIPHISSKIKLLCRVGLSYITLGQPSNTLSGGEAQRIKIAKELTRPSSGKTLYILDEPTTGLHFHDIQALIDVLHELVDKKNTVVVIEHNMDLVRTVDWIIDMGPRSGDDGGTIIDQGPPEIVSQSNSLTGCALKKQHPFSIKEPFLLTSPSNEIIKIVHASQNNLKNCTVEIPRNSITALIGPSGAGKSSLAIETLYAEGQRQFVESLPPYIRQFLHPCPKPTVESIENLSPTIALEKRHHMTNPRSTVGTMTEVYEYLRIFWARLGIAHCPETGDVIASMSKDLIVDTVLSWPLETKVEIIAPLGRVETKELENIFNKLRAQGFIRCDIDGTRIDISDPLAKIRKKTVSLNVIIDRVTPKEENKGRIYASIQDAGRLANDTIFITKNGLSIPFTLRFASPSTGHIYPEITAQTFAFNSQEGMCPDCKGLGFLWGLNIEKLPLSKTSTARDLLSLLISEDTSFLEGILTKLNIPCHTPLGSLSPEEQNILFKGKRHDGIEWLGIDAGIEIALKQFEESDDEQLLFLRQALSEKECPSCKGARLNSFATHVTIDDISLPTLASLPISKARDWFNLMLGKRKLPFAMQTVAEEIERRLQLLSSIGIGYLSLNRGAHTLSGGEAQRVKLISQIGSGLSNVIYILEEPTSGLHFQDAEKLFALLHALKNMSNTIVLIEHDLATLKHADWVIELGPQGGDLGGKVLYQGPPQNLSSSKDSVTAPFLISSKKAPVPKKILNTRSPLCIKNSCIHNLKNISCTIPTQALVSIVGPSGSGKSTLIFDVLAKAAQQQIIFQKQSAVEGLDLFSHLVLLDQSTHGYTSRSDISSYVDILTPLRSFYAMLPQAKVLGLEPKHFSPNHRSGMCTHCWGMGYKKISMHFMAPMQIPCPECNGLRINKLSLSVEYKGLSLGKLLQLPLIEIAPLFEPLKKVKKITDSLINLGLGYLKLGQEMNGLSSGEFQRVKIATEFARQGHRLTLFLLDEPTSGLHVREVHMLLDVLDGLKKRGHTIIAIEHNQDFIKASDWIIELGPGAGDEGGFVVFEGAVDAFFQKMQKNHMIK